MILIIVRFSLTKENQFGKTGLEYALLFYVAAEILSTIFSVEPGHSFHNLLKRFFLIPIIYTFLISANDFEMVGGATTVNTAVLEVEPLPVSVVEMEPLVLE